MSEAPPFGAFAPSPRQDFARRLAHHLPTNYFGKKAASLLLGPAGGRARRAFDVEIFGGAHARLHPYDNICEKRVYVSPQHWDAAERGLLAAAIAGAAGPDFTFVDVGANAGLYTLFALAAARRAGKALHALSIEPDPEMRRRLTFNLEASQAGDSVRIAPFAAAASETTLRFAPNEKSRGMSRAAADGVIDVPARPLARLIADWGVTRARSRKVDPVFGENVRQNSILDHISQPDFTETWPRIDALKIDIEGAEMDALAPFFAEAPSALWPRLLLVEISHEAKPGALAALLAANGYRTEPINALNLVARLATF